VAVNIVPTQAPLTAALDQLLDIDERFYEQSGFYNALYLSNLTVDEVTIVDGKATIWLSGSLQLGGVCDEPRIEAQLRQTALQFDTVDEVEIFVNGQPLEALL
jgi:spore germination protein GerM